jgi:diketogulonate reductase-like aldo/keto reductase
MLPSVKSSSGVRIPPIGLGTWQVQGEAVERAVRTALDAGYSHIDTARAYGNEVQVGAALATSGFDRGSLFVTSKIPRDSLGPSDVLAAGEDSARNLGGYVDLLLIHWPNPAVRLEATLEAMRELQRRRLARHIGVSNFPIKLLKRACQLAPIACNQVEYHPYLAQTELRDHCRSEGVVLSAYCPLARGRVLRDPVIRSIARRVGRSPAQVTLRWLVQQQGVVAVPKSATPERIVENLAVDDFDLDQQDMATISSLARRERLIDPPFAPKWQG